MQLSDYVDFMSVLTVIISVLVVLGALHSLKMENATRLSPYDPNSFSRPELVVMKHVNLNLTADFDAKIFHGNVQLQVEKVDESAKEIILDSQDLDITSITDKATGEALSYNFAEKSELFGSKLVIKLPTGKSFTLNIEYKTSPSASGLQWLEPAQTAGKIHPYVYSQFQAIAARSFLPCQDTPSAKVTYDAEIICPKDLKVVMSAKPVGDPVVNGANVKYAFTQPIPMQSYLIAIAIGALESRPIGLRSTVHAEKELINDAAYEFATTEEQLRTAEDICGPYVWGIYDLLVLPPSFPFGGMENPCLTFVTPSLLAGDRSLVNVISHEIAHSWTGNLVTNANFEHFWLNEGFTVFIERKIKGRMLGAEIQDFDAYGGLTTLKETVKQLGPTNEFTKLVVNLTNIHPDEAFSSIPYEKGHIFLRYLENLVGGPTKFEPFLRKYFDTYKFKSITTDDFKSFFLNYFANEDAIKEVDWDAWLHQPGMPPVIPKYDQTILNSVLQQKQVYLDWDMKLRTDFPLNMQELNAEQQIQLLDEVLDSGPQPIAKLVVWDKAWNMSTVQNAELKSRWYRIGIAAKWEPVVQPALDWVNVMGRMKYTRPIYRALYDWEEMRPKAIANFKANKKYMMHVSVSGLERDLHLK